MNATPAPTEPHSTAPDRPANASARAPHPNLDDVIAVMNQLRSEGGCPWDREQTHTSLVRYLLEETYELVDAIESGDYTHMREELGDVLLQVLFHARIAEEHPDTPFTIDDVAHDLAAKLRHRHPHVFGDTHADTPEQVRVAWEELKQQEKKRTSVLDGISRAQGALARAQKIVSRVSRDEQLVSALDYTPQTRDNETDAERIGQELLAVVRQAHTKGVDAESALRAALAAVESQVAGVDHP